ncbi:MAG: hypothetical protein PHR45_06875 [Muribaculaceae bacterium]|nr:hypothetical protein [Muribaculaceae bacterium]
MDYCIKILIYSIICLSLCISCKDSSVKSDIQILRFENDVENFQRYNDAQRVDFKNKYKDVISIIHHNEMTDSAIIAIPTSSIYTIFRNDVDNLMKSKNDSINLIINNIDKSCNTIFVNNKFPKVITIITPYNQSIVTTDSSLMIGINHYLGENHKMYSYFASYIRHEKNFNRLKFDIAEAITRRKLDNFKPLTFLDNLIYEGIVANIELDILIDNDIKDVLNYSNEQYEWCLENEENIWKEIIARDMLYSTSTLTIKGIFDNAPYSTTFSQNVPAKIGRFIGYKIIQEYCKKENINNLASSYNNIIKYNSQNILIKSHYNGR